MTQHVYTTLREANRVRQAEWDKDGQISLSYRGNELAGEVGEACNIIKKLERARLGIRGSRASVEDLAAELADVVICADLIAMAEAIDLDEAVAAKFNATSEKVGLQTRLRLQPPIDDLLREVQDEEDRLAEYLEGYEFRGDQDYTPTEHERLLIEDALRGWVSEEGLRSDASAAEQAKALFSANLQISVLTELLNTPEVEDFAKGVMLEAPHQRHRWGSERDAGKQPLDWVWLLGHLINKAAKAALDGDVEKAKHHTISSAAALANWHAALAGTNTAMRPGIDAAAVGLETEAV